MTTLLPDLMQRRIWVFDLDNTLYPPEARLFDQIEKRMTAYVMDQLGVTHDRANHLRKHYWKTYGTTLAGLMREHDVDPEPYLVDVHDIDLAHLPRDNALKTRIAALPGRKIVYTNGSAPYAERVLEARGLTGTFDAIYGVEHADYHPKPHPDAFRVVFARDKLRPEAAVMFEDESRNLAVPHALGLGTVHVTGTPDDAPHVHYSTKDLSAFLHGLLH